MLVFIASLLFLCSSAQREHDTDYCEMLGQDDIQGKKHGFLAGNNVYYIGGFYASQNLHENETIGLTHPFFHDHRSRGTGITYYEGVGTGNDFYGWEFYKQTKVAYGTVVTDEMRWETPPPTRMYWRPDKMIVEYELGNPYLEGVYDGWCRDWNEGSSNGTSHWINLEEEECWDHCIADTACFQAVFEVGKDLADNKCWIGLNKMTDPPTGGRCPTCEDKCYAKSVSIPPVFVREEKFISANDVVSTIITSDRPVRLEITGHSFGGSNHITSLSADCVYDPGTNSVHVTEGGKVMVKVSENPVVEKEGVIMYDGMSTIISSTRKLEDITINEIIPGQCGYNFSVPLDDQGTTISWTMNDEAEMAFIAVEEILENPSKYLKEKTEKMNNILNNLVPYFRCSDDEIVKIYYYLWSLHMMYYKEGSKGMDKLPHTQTAVNNFLGLHRYDSVFQILVGSWVSPKHHSFFANGNVLAWSAVLPYRDGDKLPDNFGIDWVSGVYGPTAIAHPIGAWQVYQHSGNQTFLAEAYTFYKELFWDGISGKHWGYAYDSVVCLNKMADILGFTEDPQHWNETVNMDNVDHWLNNEWEKDTPGMFGSTQNRMGFSNIAPAAISMFPREWVDIMAREWLNDPVKGFFGEVPLTTIALQDFPGADIVNSFAVVPDANWYMIRALYLHTIDGLANKFTLAHLKKYNMEWGIPVAPEGRHADFSLFGDQYSNFNAGKILLILDGLAGLGYSVHDDSFTFADNLPLEWSFMEFHVPVQKPGEDAVWVKARAERHEENDTFIKSVTVESNPFKRLIIRPWEEDSEVIAESPSDGKDTDPPAGHSGWIFSSENGDDASNANIILTLKPV